MKESERVFWVIERGSSAVFPPCSGALEYLSFSGQNVEGDPRDCSGDFAWHHHVYDAIQFTRKRDAVRCLVALRGMADVMPFNSILPSLRPNDQMPRVVEHAWMRGPDLSEETPKSKVSAGETETRT